MQCEKINELLSSYFDGNTTLPEGKAVSEHLSACPNCRAEWHALHEAIEAIKTLPEVSPPSEFGAAVIHKIVSGTERKRPAASTNFTYFNRPSWSRVMALAAAVVITVGITAVIYGMPGQWGTNKMFTEQDQLKIAENSFINNSLTEDESSVTDDSPPSPPSETLPEKPLLDTDLPVVTDPHKKEQPAVDTENTAFAAKADSPETTLASYRTVAAVEGNVSRGAAFGLVPASGPDSRKIIRTASLGLNVNDRDGAVIRLNSLAVNSGGSLLKDDSDGTIAILVPADRFEILINAIQGMDSGSTIYQIGREDVTERYYSYEDRLRTLAAVEQKLTANKNTDYQTVQTQLAQIRGDMETQKKLLNRLAKEIDVATITVRLD